MAEKAPPSSSGSGDILTSLIGLALLVGTPIALGWLSEKTSSRKQTEENITPKNTATILESTDQPVKPPKASTAHLYSIMTRDISSQDRRGELHKIHGRKREIDRLLTLLSGEKPECILLIGDPGIGKTALVEGTAQAIQSGKTASLKSCAIIEFRPECLTSNGKQNAEEDARAFLEALTASQDEAIAFFDNFENFLQLSKSNLYHERNSLNLLKVALQEHKFRAIMCISSNGYNSYLKNDSGWAGVFTELRLEKRDSPGEPFGELTRDQTFAVLEQHSQSFPKLYARQVRHDAIDAAINLSEKYITSSRLPGKAIQLLEETAKRLRIRPDAVPWELMALEEKIEALQLKRERLYAQNDPHQQSAIAEADQQLEALKTQRRFLEEKWRSLRKAQNAMIDLAKKIAMTNRAMESAKLNKNAGLAVEYRGQIQNLLAQRTKADADLEPIQSSFFGYRDYLNANDVAFVLEEQIGIPVQLASRDEKDMLRRLEENLHQRIIGQEDAVDAIAKAIRRARTGLSAQGRPVGNFLFLGPTGVGKTELAKAIADVLYGGEHAMVRLDMSEYHGPHAVARMIGAPPGYVGYEGGGQLTEAVRHRPNSVILLDEIEKADAKVLDILLQVLDDGRMTDGRGITVDFQHTIVIMTSNIGSDLILEKGAEQAEPLVREQLGRYLRPEFINRLDAIIFFKPLSRQQLLQIAQLELKKHQTRLKDQHSISLALSDDALEYIVDQSYSPKFGAREIKRKIQELILDPLVLEILNGKFTSGAVLNVDYQNEKLVFQTEMEKTEHE